MSKITQKDLLYLEELKEDLKAIKQAEIELRNKIINHFRYGDKVEGVQHKSIADSDIDICINLRLNRKIDNDAIETLWSDLNQEQRDCIKYVPELKVAPYKKLVNSGKAGKLVNCVIESPGQATVNLKYEE